MHLEQNATFSEVKTSGVTPAEKTKPVQRANGNLKVVTKSFSCCGIGGCNGLINRGLITFSPNVVPLPSYNIKRIFGSHIYT